LLWKRKVRNFLDSKTSILKADVISARSCDLGKWLYSEGVVKHLNINEIRQLEEIHRVLHETANVAIKLKKANESDKAELEFVKLNALSKKLINLLTLIGMKVN